MVADCPKPAYCRSACRRGKTQTECVNSCLYLADQCCTFCFTSSFGSNARSECIGQCRTTVQQELENSNDSKAQHSATGQRLANNKQSNVTQWPVLSKSSVPSRSNTHASPRQPVKVATAHTAVTQHSTTRLRKQDPWTIHAAGVPVAPTATVAPPPQCPHCQKTSHPMECSIQCAAMHEACTTNCLVLYEGPSARQPCIDQCISLVTVQSSRAFLTPPPSFDVIDATPITPAPGPALSNPASPIPRSSPQATKAANALHENGVMLPDNVGLKLRHQSLELRPALTLSLL